MSSPSAPAPGPVDLAQTAWSRTVPTPLREFLRTETGGAAVLLAAVVAALVWVNVDGSSYQSVWQTALSIDIGDWGVSLSLREWVNSGLMTFFFFVLGLEARREFDLGELRERQRAMLPLLAGVSGMACTVAIYLAFNAGEPSAHGWGVAMSTDTAFALGLLALVGARLPNRLRAFMLTAVVIDDLLALIVIATVYSEDVSARALLLAAVIFAGVVVATRIPIRAGLFYLAAGIAAWLALLESGVDPIVIGLGMGLLAYAASPERSALERATERFREFREQPTPELARFAGEGVRAAISPNERLQLLWHPWSSYVVVPLFALANAGVVIDADVLGRAFTSPITLGILVGYVVGKPVGVLGATWLATRLSGGRLRPPVGWVAIAGGGTIAGIGFTVALLVATIAFAGEQLEEAKIGILSAAASAAALTWLIFRATDFLPRRTRLRALLGSGPAILDLAVEVDAARDHIRGPHDAPVTVLEYGDFECPFCGQAETALRDLLSEFGDVRYVWRHLPLNDVHPDAQLAAEASEAAAAQGAFWEMHDLLLEHQAELRPRHLLRYAEELGLDVERFRRDLHGNAGAARVAADVDSADLSGVSGTPTFFVNGRRHYGAYDISTLAKAVKAAGARAALGSQAQSP